MNENYCEECGTDWNVDPMPCTPEGCVNGAAEWSDSAPDYVKNVATLYRWGLNYADALPFRVFLNLTGWAEDTYGEPLPVGDGVLGYVEIDYLADALKEYVTRPRDVNAFVGDLMEIESVVGA